LWAEKEVNTQRTLATALRSKKNKDEGTGLILAKSTGRRKGESVSVREYKIRVIAACTRAKVCVSDKQALASAYRILQVPRPSRRRFSCPGVSFSFFRPSFSFFSFFPLLFPFFFSTPPSPLFRIRDKKS